jgi:hypothetical protein
VNIYAADGNSAREPIAIPFTNAGHLVIVDVTLNGSRPLSFVLDSGSARMVVDNAVSRELGLHQTGAETIGGAGAGRVPVHRIDHVGYALGGLTPAECEFVAADLSPVTQQIGHRVDGIVGYHFFNRFIITIDYAHHELYVRERGAELNNAGEELPIRINKGWSFVRGTLGVEGERAVTDEFLIDSGSDDAIDHPVAQQVHDRTATRTGNGLGASVAGFLATADSFRLGSHELRNLPISCCGGTEQTSRLIGGAVLSRFTVTFDYPHSRIFLAPVKSE